MFHEIALPMPFGLSVNSYTKLDIPEEPKIYHANVSPKKKRILLKIILDCSGKKKNTRQRATTIANGTNVISATSFVITILKKKQSRISINLFIAFMVSPPMIGLKKSISIVLSFCLQTYVFF